MGKVRTLIIAGILFFCMFTLSAQILVDYQPSDSLVFEIGSSPLFPDRNMIAYLGSMSFSATNNSALFDPTFMQVSQVTSGISFSGDRYSYTDNGIPKYNQGSFGFRIVAVTTFTGGNVTKQDITISPGTPMIPNSSGNQLNKIIDIKLYLVSWETNMNAIARLGSSYVLTSNNLGTFNIATAKSGSGYYNGFSYASINGQTVPANGAPSTGQAYSNTLITSIPYGAAPPQAEYLLSIIDENSFTITSAYGGLSTRIARAKLFLSNTQPNQQYGIDIMFSNRINSAHFALHLDNDQSLYAIPYTLLFNGQEVEGGKSIRWEDLVSDDNFKDIMITKVDSTKADMAPAGEYFDTITVTITPSDTI